MMDGCKDPTKPNIIINIWFTIDGKSFYVLREIIETKYYVW